MATNFYKLWLLADPRSELSEELGDLGRSEVETLFERLSGRSLERGDRLLYRACPSLILRGEAQLLELSDPRFGFRLLVRDKGAKLVALVNLRRVGRLLDQFRGVKSSRVPIQRLLRGPMDRRSLSCIADCLIPVPTRFADSKTWRVARLPDIVTRHYGEDFRMETVPFLRPLQFISGGLCAQACCWMADHYGYSMEVSHPVHALPDITWRARST